MDSSQCVGGLVVSVRRPVLGPVLFDICINDLEEVSTDLQMTSNWKEQLTC